MADSGHRFKREMKKRISSNTTHQESHTPVAGQQQPCSLLMKLPRELRDQIFQHLVVFASALKLKRSLASSTARHQTQKRRPGNSQNPQTPKIKQTKSRLPKRESTLPRNLAIFLVNKQCCAEAREIFLKENRFHFSTENLKSWEDFLLMRDVTMDVECAADLPWVADLLSQSSPFDCLTVKVRVRESSKTQDLEFHEYRDFLCEWRPSNGILDVLQTVKVRNHVQFDFGIEYELRLQGRDGLGWLNVRLPFAERAQHHARFMAMFKPVADDMLSQNGERKCIDREEIVHG